MSITKKFVDIWGRLEYLNLTTANVEIVVTQTYHTCLRSCVGSFERFEVGHDGRIIKNPELKQQSLKAAGWIAFVLVFFSLCGGKRNLYILSVYPAAALLTASVLPEMRSTPAWLGKAPILEDKKESISID